MGDAFEAVAARVMKQWHRLVALSQQTCLTGGETDPARVRTEVAFAIR